MCATGRLSASAATGYVLDRAWPRERGHGTRPRLVDRRVDRITRSQDGNSIPSILFILSRVRAVRVRDDGGRSKFSVGAISKRRAERPKIGPDPGMATPRHRGSFLPSTRGSGGKNVSPARSKRCVPKLPETANRQVVPHGGLRVFYHSVRNMPLRKKNHRSSAAAKLAPTVPRATSPARRCRSSRCVGVGDTGLEPVTPSLSS